MGKTTKRCIGDKVGHPERLLAWTDINTRKVEGGPFKDTPDDERANRLGRDFEGRVIEI